MIFIARFGVFFDYDSAGFSSDEVDEDPEDRYYLVEANSLRQAEIVAVQYLGTEIDIWEYLEKLIEVKEATPEDVRRFSDIAIFNKEGYTSRPDGATLH